MALLKLSRNLGFDIPLNLNQQKLNEDIEKYECYSDKFGEICKLEIGDKLGRDASGAYYRHEQGVYFIQLRRWWTNQGRNQTVKCLDEDFTEFMKYLDKIMKNCNVFVGAKYRKFAVDIRNLVNSLMTGLYQLKKTYPTEKVLVCKIDSIIMALIDFKNSIGEILDIPVGKRKRTRRELI